MSLEAYNKKRDFSVTPEPKGRIRTALSSNLAFVVQKHAARNLHYDFRLEFEGVLLSWSVPKGPTLEPDVRRSAIRTEDHPIEYLDFEGIIPKDEYGGGTVMVWDRGIWRPLDDAKAGLRRGRLRFLLFGEKLSGRWSLVRDWANDEREVWWLIKADDEAAKRGKDTDIVTLLPDSVASGRTIEEIRRDQDRVWHSNRGEVVAESVKRTRRSSVRPSRINGAKKSPMPRIIESTLATSVEEAPKGNAWLHEIKHDGYRMLCRIEGGEAQFLSRKQQDWTQTFPALSCIVGKLPIENAWLDGEVVVIGEDGRSSFQALQESLSANNSERLSYVVFDLLYLDGFDLRGAPLIERKKVLKSLVEGQSQKLRYSDHVQGRGEDFYESACALGVEGMVSKRSDSRYTSIRTTDWLKIKCKLADDFVIGGYTASDVRKFRGLLLGRYDEAGKLRYVGRVGTGFSERSLVELHEKLNRLQQEKSPFAQRLPTEDARGAHWVRPVLVAHILFTEWTRDGKIRLPSFQGLRLDLTADDLEYAPGKNEKSPSAIPLKRSVAGPKGKTAEVMSGVRVTHADKILYPEGGYTKRDLADYYQAVANFMLPHLRDRALTLVRCPEGPASCFYQKSIHEKIPEALDVVEFNERTTGDRVKYLVANTAPALITLLQMNVLEFHTWGSRTSDMERPDRIVWDLDPGGGVGWLELVQAATVLRTLLSELGLESLVKTTGGKGLHVVVPIAPERGWDEIKGFSKAVADFLVRGFPDRFTSALAKKKRDGKIFIDYLRNVAGATVVAAYSRRAKRNAPVSTPLGWDELGEEDVRFDYFNVRNIPERLKRLRKDPWSGHETSGRVVTVEMMKIVGYRPS
jgi:bifunctional non-homologous end joining protein LigD